MFRWVPGLQAVPSYQRIWLARDIIAGVVLTTLLVPQGMAYAELAGLPPITGLYTSILCLLGYAVFGPSRILVLGPDSSLGPMIAATILPLIAANGDEKRAVALASMLAIMVAAVMIVAAIAKTGFIADLISKPTMIGYLNGLALTILVGQLPKLFGFKVEPEGLIGEAAHFVKGLADGKAVAAAAVGIAGIAVILVLQRWLPKVPAVLVMVVLAIAAASVFRLADHRVSLVGVLPKGFPPRRVRSSVEDDGTGWQQCWTTCTSNNRAAGSAAAGGTFMTAETPVLDTLADLTAASAGHNSLPAREFMLARIAALIAMDAPPASYLTNAGAAADIGITAEDVQGVMIAVAPVVGTARVVSAGGNVLRGLGLAIAVADAEASV